MQLTDTNKMELISLDEVFLQITAFLENKQLSQAWVARKEVLEDTIIIQRTVITSPLAEANLLHETKIEIDVWSESDAQEDREVEQEDVKFSPTEPLANHHDSMEAATSGKESEKESNVGTGNIVTIVCAPNGSEGEPCPILQTDNAEINEFWDDDSDPSEDDEDKSKTSQRPKRPSKVMDDSEYWHDVDVSEPPPERKVKVKRGSRYNLPQLTSIQKTKSGSFSCPKCSAVFRDRDGLLSHFKEKHGRIFTCPSCPAKFRTKTAEHYHRDLIHNDGMGKNQCSQCSLKFHEKLYMNRHIKDCHSAELDETNGGTGKRHDCEYCDNFFLSWFKLFQHIAQEHKETLLYCATCTKACINEDKLLEHIRKHHPSEGILLECPHCKKHFVSDKRLCYHIDEYHEDKTLELVKPFVCPVDFCQKKFQLETSIAMHAKLHNQWDLPDSKLKGRNNKVKNRKAKPENSCRFCVSAFQSSTELYNHMTQFHKDEMFHCRVCTKPFLIEFQLQDHMRKFHPDARPSSICPYCQKSFVSEKSLSYHTDEYHEEKSLASDKPFVCPVGFCQKKFQLRSSIARHARMHSQCDLPQGNLVGRRENKKKKASAKKHDVEVVPCDKCGELVSEDDMKKHLKKHTTYPCKKCSQVFQTEQGLKGHLLAKHLNFQLKCPHEQCGKIFASRNVLKAHTDLIHKNPTRHQCNQCDKSFFLKHDLNSHIKGVHEGIKVDCSFCGRKFVRTSEKNRHERQVHGAKLMDPLDLEEIYLQIGVLLCQLNQYQIWELQKDSILERITVQRVSAQASSTPQANILSKIEIRHNDSFESIIETDEVGDENCCQKNNEVANNDTSPNLNLMLFQQMDNETATSAKLHPKIEVDNMVAVSGIDNRSDQSDCGEFDAEDNQPRQPRDLNGRFFSITSVHDAVVMPKNRSSTIKSDLDIPSHSGLKSCSVLIPRVIVNELSKSNNNKSQSMSPGVAGKVNSNPKLKQVKSAKKKKPKGRSTRKTPVKKDPIYAKFKNKIEQDPDFIPAKWDPAKVDNPIKPKPSKRKSKYPMELKEGIYQCLKCPFSSPHHSVMIRHCIREHLVEYNHQCSICPMKFRTQKALAFHFDYIHNNSSGKYTCFQCKRKFKKANCLRLHQKSVHIPKSKGSLKPVKCHFCSIELPSFMARDAHLIQAHKDQLYFCQICFEPRTSERIMMKHLKSKHRDVPLATLNCKFCDQEFLKEESLYYHEDEDHEDEDFGITKSFICEFASCQKPFRKESFLQRHLGIHSKSKKKRLYQSHKITFTDKDSLTEELSPCPTCGLLFTKSMMAVHLNGNHLEKQHSCKDCGKVFSVASKLKVHRLAAHKKMQITCPIDSCGKVFSRRDCLRNHLQNAHENKVAHQCNLCEKSFAYEADLKVHVKGVHEGKKAPCSVCGKEFLRSSERNRHEKQVHKDVQCQN